MITHAERMTTHELRELLHAHFIRPEDRVSQAGAGAVYLTEVTVPGGRQRADAVHIGMWASRGGGRIDVCELKASRGDWLRELDNPGKAEAWWPYCNAFWLVVPTADIVKDGELPRGWGLMTPSPRANSRRFKVIVKPEEREAKLTIPLLCTLLTNTETTKVNALRQQETALRDKFNKQVEEVRRARGVFSSKDKGRLAVLDRLEAALGLTLDEYPWEGQISPEAAAEGLKAFMQGQAAIEQANRSVEHLIRDLHRAANSIQREADSLHKAKGV